LIPEKEPQIEKMCKHLKEAHKNKNYALVVASEGVTIPGPNAGQEELDQFGHMILKKRDIGAQLAEVIEDKIKVETRSAVIGHMQRGGAPTLFDRILGVRVGVKAAELVAEGKFGQMAALKGTEVIGVPLEQAVGELKVVTDDWWKLAEVFFK